MKKFVTYPSSIPFYYYKDTDTNVIYVPDYSLLSFLTAGERVKHENPYEDTPTWASLIPWDKQEAVGHIRTSPDTMGNIICFIKPDIMRVLDFYYSRPDQYKYSEQRLKTLRQAIQTL